MKKTFKYMLAAFAVVTAASCAQELDDPNAIPQEDVELVPMTITVGGETKTTVGDDDKSLNWCEDDVIAVFDKTGTAREFKIVEGTCNGKTATFEGLVAAGSTDFTAVYPYSAAVSVSAEGVITATAADAQVLDGGNLADGATLSVAQFKKNDAAFTFRTAIGYLRVDVDKEDVTSIIVNGTNIAGQATFNAAGELQEVKDGKGQVTITPAGETFAKGSYYVTLLPGTTPANQFDITFVRTATTGAVMTATREVTIPRNAGFFVAETKLAESFLIKDAASLKTFLSKAPEYTTGQLATIVNDIDLTGETLTSASSFKGTLDGRGHSIKNWTSNGVALFEKLDSDQENKVGGIIKNLIIDQNCKLTPIFSGDRFGFLAKETLSYSCVENCVNNAQVNVTVSSLSGTKIYGNLIGVGYGSVKGCTNNGNITILVEGNANRMNLGGVIGYSNVATQMNGGADDYMALNCTNTGNISYTVNGTSGHVYIGGVLSGSSPAEGAITAQTPSKGTVKGCVNTGNIEYTLKNGGSLEEGKGTAANGNYYNIGGVLGYAEGDVKECVNGQENTTKGSVTIIVPTMTDGNAVSRPCVGGVVGFSLFGVDSSTNYGHLSVKGSYANAGALQQGTGSFIGASFGGVAGLVGFTAAAQKVNNCKNYGDLEFDLWMKVGSGTTSYVGGVVGNSFATLSECSNNGALNLKSCAKQNRIGGIVGNCSGGVLNSTNNGVITGNFTGEAGNAQVSFGGIMGYGSRVFNGNTNNADLTLNHSSTTSGVVFGGVVGYYNDGTTGSKTASGLNTGKVTYNSDASNGACWVGGYAGYSNCPDELSGITNDAPVVFNAKGSGATYLGGLFGTVAKANMKNLTNTAKGTVTVNRLAGHMRAGGIVGNLEQAIKASNCTNSATLSIDAVNECNAQMHIGGVFGYNDKASAFTSCSNSGALRVVANSTNASFFYLSGISTASSASQTFESCSNTGDMYINSIGKWRCGGIAAYVGVTSTIKNCTVESDITYDSQTKTYLNLGGILGETPVTSLTGNSYKGTITALKSGDQINVGGMVGSTTTAGPVSYVGCVVDAQISSIQQASSGMFTGRASDNAAFVFGAETSPCKIVRGSKLNGALVEQLTDAVLVGSARETYTVTKTNIVIE